MITSLYIPTQLFACDITQFCVPNHVTCTYVTAIIIVITPYPHHCRRRGAPQPVAVVPARRAGGPGGRRHAALLLRAGGRGAVLGALVPPRARVLPLRAQGDAAHYGLPAAGRYCGRQ